MSERPGPTREGWGKEDRLSDGSKEVPPFQGRVDGWSTTCFPPSESLRLSSRPWLSRGRDQRGMGLTPVRRPFRR